MKKLLLTLSLALISALAFSQYYYIPHINAGTNPGGLNTDAEYPVGSGLPTGWTQVLGGSQTSPTWSAVQTIPFAFNFNGGAVSSYKVSSSGVLTFNTAATAVPGGTNAALPNASIPDSSICVWGLEGSGSNDIIVSKNFGTAPNRQHWVFFTSYFATGATSGGWTYWSIVLEETSNNIYIVDQRTGNFTTALTAGIQINSTTATMVAGSPNLANHAGISETQADNSYYEFIYGTQASYDISMINITTNPYLSLSAAPFSITGNLSNFGTTTITGFDLNYSIDNGTPVTTTLSGLSIATFSNYAFTHGTAWTPTATGTYTIKTWASNLNGSNVDQNNANDTAIAVVQVVSNMVQRLPLFEVFTSSTCGPCVPGNTALKALFDANPGKMSMVKYQMTWPAPGDPYNNADGNTRRSYYGTVNSVPRLFVDGGFDGNPTGFTQTLFNSQYNIPSFIDITSEFDVTSGFVNVRLTVEALTDFGSANLKLFVAIVENTTTGNVMTNGETIFYFVEQKMVPNGNGTVLSGLSPSSPYTNSFSASLQATNVEDQSDLSVVIWVQDNTTKEVMQSAWAVETTGLDEFDGSGISTLFPNPASGQAMLRYAIHEQSDVSVQIMNINGQVVRLDNLGKQTSGSYEHIIDLNGLSDGLYMVRLQAGDKVYTRKLLVQ